jgi:hypothetical protein
MWNQERMTKEKEGIERRCHAWLMLAIICGLCFRERERERRKRREGEGKRRGAEVLLPNQCFHWTRSKRISDAWGA